jgi:hypothetical protein
MAEIPLGFSLEETDDGFILRNKSADRVVTEIKMRPEDLHGLKATIDLWTDRKMSSFQTTSGSVRPIVVYPVATAGLWPDAVQENVLLTVEGPSSGRMTLSVPLSVAANIAFELPGLLARMREAQSPTKQ